MGDWIRHSLGNKILAAVSVCIVLVMAAEIALRLNFGRSDRIEITRTLSMDLAAATYAGIRYPMSVGDNEAVKHALADIRQDMADVEVYVCDDRGRIVWSTHSDTAQSHLSAVLAGPEALAAVAAMLEQGRPPDCSFDDTSHGKKALVTMLPIRNRSECVHCHGESRPILGGMVVRTDFQHSIERMTAGSIRTVLVTMVGIAALIILISFQIRKLVRLPVANLVQGAGAVASGDLDVVIPVTSLDELGGLAKSFNQMTGELRAARGEIERWTHSLEELVEERTTQLKKAQEGAIQAEKMASIGRMAAIVAHEINNPISGIRTYARLLLKKQGEIFVPGISPNLIRYLETIESEAVRCGEIVKSLLQFSRPTRLQLAPQRLAPLIAEAVGLVQPQLEATGCRVDQVAPVEGLMVACDPQRLKQALVAILINATNAVVKDQGVIEVGCQVRGDGQTVAVAIRDNGAGMDEETRQRMFEPFFTTKLDQLKENAGPNIGLGLTVVDEIVRLHGGEIQVQSQKGAGTTITIILPLALSAVTSGAHTS
ncbi:MAG: ATP-binding protein [Thermodesulfobacteriota bacterium]